MRIVGSAILVTAFLFIGIAVDRMILNPVPPETAREFPAETALPDPPPETESLLPERAESLSLSPARFAYGRLPEGVKRTKTVRINRTEAGEFTFTRLFSPCPCVDVNASRRRFGPSEAGAVTVTLHTLSLQGSQKFPFFVEAVDGRGKARTLQGEVSVEVTRVPALIHLEPAELSFGKITVDKKLSVRITNLTKHMVKLEQISCDLPGARVTVAKLSFGMDEENAISDQAQEAVNLLLDGGETVELFVALTSAKLPSGTLAGKLTIATDCGAHALLAVPLRGTVQP